MNNLVLVPSSLAVTCQLSRLLLNGCPWSALSFITPAGCLAPLKIRNVLIQEPTNQYTVCGPTSVANPFRIDSPELETGLTRPAIQMMHDFGNRKRKVCWKTKPPFRQLVRNESIHRIPTKPRNWSLLLNLPGPWAVRDFVSQPQVPFIVFF